MTIPRLISHAAGFMIAAAIALETASFAADPLRPDATEQLQVVEPPIFISLLHLGPFDLHPQVTAGATYDDNFTLSASNERADWIWTVSPTLAAVADNRAEGYGTLLTLEYSPSFVIFTQHGEHDGVNHHASLAASWAGSKLSLGLIQTFDQTEGGVVEVGQRLQQRQYTTQLASKYKLGERTSVELNPRLSIAETEGLIGYTEWGADSFLNRVITAKITGSAGGSFGYIEVSDGPIQIYQRALARCTYALSGKVQLEASAGGEWREFHGGLSDTFTPVFGIGGAYRPFEGTTITLEARRRDEISVALTNQDYTATGVTLGIRQRIMERLHVTVTGSYDNRDYHASGTGVSAIRRDDLYTLRAGMGMNLGRHWTVDVFYQYSKDSTNDPTLGFTDNQFGLLGTWKL